MAGASEGPESWMTLIDGLFEIEGKFKLTGMAIDKLAQKLQGMELLKERVDDMANGFAELKSLTKSLAQELHQCSPNKDLESSSKNSSTGGGIGSNGIGGFVAPGSNGERKSMGENGVRVDELRRALKRVELPIFDGSDPTDPTGWIARAEK